ncbi:MAG: GNAT family N-acetyltransferase [Christensenellaceae bacterium]|nr:GNAT family N-acetyltransferase [Christensenellaceae bacterium]
MLDLKKYTENDYTLYSQLVFNEQTMNMNLGRVFTDDEAASFFQMVLRCNIAKPDLGFYKVFAKQGKDIQYIGMGALNWNDDYNAIEIEYMLLPQYWNQGHGTELVKLLLQMANKARRELDVVAITDPKNIYSKRLLQRVGFTLVKQYVNDDGDLAELYIKRTEHASK